MADVKLASFVLLVRDMAAAKKFYMEMLGQEIALDVGRNVGFTSGLALWEREYAQQTVYGRTHADRDCREVEVYFETADLEGMQAAFRERAVPFVHDIVVQPWQQRVFRVCDPDGFVVEIAESMEQVIRRLHAAGADAETISSRTFMPLAVVRAVVGEA